MTIQANTVMSMEHFHDFYFLQALEAAVTTELSAHPELEFSKAVEKFQNDLDRTNDLISTNMALRTFMYLYAACLGEARHARDTVAKTKFMMTTGRSRTDWFASVSDYAPTDENLRALLSVFEQDWRAGYGGKAWLNIAQALVDYTTTPAAAWLDHVVDLEHNNGTAFSKPEGKKTIYFDVNYPTRFSSFLDYKFSCDILRTRPNFVCYLNVSPRVKTLLERFSTVFRFPEVRHALAKLDNLGPYVVEWGVKTIAVSEKWADWIAVGDSNEPNAKVVLENAGLYNFYVSSCTQRKFAKVCKKIKRRAIGKLNPVYKVKMAKQVTNVVEMYFEDHKKECKMPKAKKTYHLLPVTVETVAGAMHMMFDLPYQKGYGTPTDYGFELTEKVGASVNCVGYITKSYGDICLWTGSNTVWVNSPVLEALLEEK